jgi:hypothetical protein
LLIPVSGYVRNATGYFIGLAVVTIDTQRFQSFLDAFHDRSIQTFLIVNGSYVFAASVGTPFSIETDSTPGNITPFGPVPPGCVTSLPFTPHVTACMAPIPRYSYAPLRILARENFSPQNPDIVITSEAGGAYVLLRVPIVRMLPPRSNDLLNLDMILIVDVNGLLSDVRAGHGIAIGVCCAIFIVGLICCVPLMLSIVFPLKNVTRAIWRAANLMDDPVELSDSRLLEVHDLLESCRTMQKNMARLKQFTPHQLLVRQTDEMPADYEGVTICYQ